MKAHPHDPDVCNCFGNHQHADQGEGRGEENHGNVEEEAEGDGQPHETEGLVVSPGGSTEKQDDNKKP